VAAASLGTCVDLYAVSPSAVGLPFLQPLSQATGGAMYLYAGPEESALPQVCMVLNHAAICYTQNAGTRESGSGGRRGSKEGREQLHASIEPCLP
jgi:hypothetical protein